MYNFNSNTTYGDNCSEDCGNNYTNTFTELYTKILHKNINYYDKYILTGYILEKTKIIEKEIKKITKKDTFGQGVHALTYDYPEYDLQSFHDFMSYRNRVAHETKLLEPYEFLEFYKNFQKLEVWIQVFKENYIPKDYNLEIEIFHITNIPSKESFIKKFINIL